MQTTIRIRPDELDLSLIEKLKSLITSDDQIEIRISNDRNIADDSVGFEEACRKVVLAKAKIDAGAQTRPMDEVFKRLERHIEAL